MTYTITGLAADALRDVLSTGVDHAGAPVEPFVDADSGWPLRCCLTDSAVGERLAIIAFSPFPWTGAYAERGPVVVHVDRCPGDPDGSLPEQFADRRQLLRAYGHDRAQVYDLNRFVEPGDLDGAIREVLADGRVDFVQARNVLPGCYSFTATRAA